jgi:hypothetical protein
MERVETLVQKLSKQFNEGANPSLLLLTVQMLQHELLHLQHGDVNGHSFAHVHMPGNTPASTSTQYIVTPVEEPKEEERTVEVLQVDEAAIEAELDDIKRKAEAVQRMSLQSRTQSVFEMMDDEVPTLVHQQTKNKKAINKVDKIVQEIPYQQEAASLNDSLKQENIEISQVLNESPIKDLRKAIGINDRFVYISELFRGDETMYERSIKTINSFTIWPEAEYWIRRELKVKLGWQDDYVLVQQFDQLVKRRFS